MWEYYMLRNGEVYWIYKISDINITERTTENTRERNYSYTIYKSSSYLHKCVITCNIKATRYTATKSDAVSRSPQGHAKFTIPGSKRIFQGSQRFSYIYVYRYGNFDPRRRSHARRIVGRRSTSTVWNLQATLSCLPSNGI